MRVLFFILTIAFLTSCFVDKAPEVERDIFISSFDTGFDANGNFFLKDTTKAIRFTRDFWNYFIRTHPISSAMIFMNPLHDTNHNYLTNVDASYSYYNVNHMESFYFQKLVADSVSGHEKENPFGGSFYIIPNDTTGEAAREQRVESKLKDYKVTPTITKEFERLKRILTWKDTSEHYVIVFKKTFADKIYQLYE